MSSRKTTAGGSSAGRPRKFKEPSRPITVTLPERILKLLEAVDRDRARAIVKVAQAATSTSRGRGVDGFVQLVEVSPGIAIIEVAPSAALGKIGWLRLVEIAPARFLVSVPTGTPLEKLEVAIIDLLASLGPDEDRERKLLVELRDLIAQHRRADKLSKYEIVFVAC
ncbi:MAG: hypothetical protein AB1714_12395 [Acidobacteriota bacterium]